MSGKSHHWRDPKCRHLSLDFSPFYPQRKPKATRPWGKAGLPGAPLPGAARREKLADVSTRLPPSFPAELSCQCPVTPSSSTSQILLAVSLSSLKSFPLCWHFPQGG